MPPTSRRTAQASAQVPTHAITEAKSQRGFARCPCLFRLARAVALPYLAGLLAPSSHVGRLAGGSAATPASRTPRRVRMPLLPGLTCRCRSCRPPFPFLLWLTYQVHA
jgi:hypothetical protein